MMLKKEIIDIIKLCDALPQEKKLVLKRAEDYVVQKMIGQYPGSIKKIERVYSPDKTKLVFVFGKSIGTGDSAAKLFAYNASQGHVLVSLENNLNNPKYRNLAFILTYFE